MKTKENLEKKLQRMRKHVEELVQRDPKLLHCDTSVSFNDSHLALPIVTKEGHVVETAYCPGYEREKYLVAVSNQIGCAVKCKFCEISDSPYIRSMTPEEIVEELVITLQQAIKRGYIVGDRPLKISFVKIGDALLNRNFGKALEQVEEVLPVSMKISSTYPATKSSTFIFDDIVDFAKEYEETVQLQISLHSTDPDYRQSLVRIPLANFEQIRKSGEKWKYSVPNSRKINLTFTVNEDTPLEPSNITEVLPPDLFAVRLRNWLPTYYGACNDIKAPSMSKIEESERKFIDCGYQIIPGRTGEVETDNKLSGGRIMRLYNHLRA